VTSSPNALSLGILSVLIAIEKRMMRIVRNPINNHVENIVFVIGSHPISHPGMISPLGAGICGPVLIASSLLSPLVAADPVSGTAKRNEERAMML
jgi:hypothetical protein